MGAGTVIAVNTSVLRSDITTISGELKAVRNAMEKLHGLTTLLGKSWEGEANSAFTAKIRRELGRLEELVRALEQFTVRTDEARGEYERCEGLVSQIIASIRV